MKKKRRLKRWVIFILFPTIFLYILGIIVSIVTKSNTKASKNETVLEEIKKEPIIEKKEEELIEDIIIEEPKQYYDYRLTSFWNNDGFGTGSCTGSGLCEKDFQINDRGWYTYNNKIVLAAATYECLNSRSGPCGNWNYKKEGKIYYKYYDEIEIIIDGISYEGIILDSCGGCMYIDYEQRIDLFVSGEKYAIDRGYLGNNVVSVFKEDLK